MILDDAIPFAADVLPRRLNMWPNLAFEDASTIVANHGVGFEV